MSVWKWAVIYKDGSEIHEDDNTGFGMVNIPEASKLVVFDEAEPTKQFVVELVDDMRPIFFRRMRQLHINDPETVPVEYIQENGEIQTTITFATVLGWQKTVNNKNVKNMIWLLHDGSVLNTDRDIDELT